MAGNGDGIALPGLICPFSVVSAPAPTAAIAGLRLVILLAGPVLTIPAFLTIPVLAGSVLAIPILTRPLLAGTVLVGSVLAIPALLTIPILAFSAVLIGTAAIGFLLRDGFLSRFLLAGLWLFGGRGAGFFGLLRFNRLSLAIGLFARLGIVGSAIGASRLSGGSPVASRVGRGFAVAFGTYTNELEDHVHDVRFAGFCVWPPAHGLCDDLKLRPVFALKFGPRELSGLYAHDSPLKCHTCGDTSFC